jgi:hypothetical protein
MKKTIPTAQSAAHISAVIDLLTGTPERLTALSRALPDEQLGRPFGPGERSFCEVLAHMVNSEARTSEAIFATLLLDQPRLLDIHPERQWGRLLRIERLPFPDLLAYFNLRRTVLLSVLASLTENQWARTAVQEGKKRHESVYWLARALALHEQEHLREIEMTMK